MNNAPLLPFAQLIRSQRVAALGTVRVGAPLVSLVAYAVRPDFSAFYLHLSQLAPHTQALLTEARISLMIAQPDDGGSDPFALPRLSIQGYAIQLAKPSPDFDAVRALYLARFPMAEPMFNLGDFDLYQLEPQSARYIAGFGQSFNLDTGHFRKAAALG